VVGKTFGQYEIREPLGAGGMGEVYRARDTRLDRDVAIKRLTEDFAADPDRLARFEREAKLLASLNHTNIAAIYGLEDFDGQRFIAMELVEGEALQERLSGTGRIEVEEALRIARQIAAALEAAHEKSVVHRDLKPANVMITPDDGVKVLDFGLAKSYEPKDAKEAPSEVHPELSHSPTMMAATRTGVILGTAAYMSPEQARGKAVGSRSDVFAFGTVLYEMLTGKPAFAGETVTDVLASIVKETPDWEALPAELPPSVGRLIERCLRKPPAERLQHMGDARIVLDDALQAPAGSAAAVPQALSGGPIGPKLATVAAGALLLGMVLAWVGAGLIGAGAGTASPALTWHLGFEVGVPLGGVAVSPDGRDIFYITRAPGDEGFGTTALAPEGARRLYHRPANRPEAQEVLGAEGTWRMAFSPDGAWLALMTQDLAIKKLAVADRRALDLGRLEAGQAQGVAWVSNDTLVLGAGSAGLWLLPASGGTPRLAAAAAENERYSFPDPLPAGRHVLAARRVGRPAPLLPETDIVAVDLESGEVTPLGIEGTNPRYVDTGHIVFARDYGQFGGGARVAGTLFAVPFDADALRTTGDPVQTPIHPAVFSVVSGTGAAYFDIASSGVLSYIPEQPLPSLSLVWVDEDGNEEAASQQRGAYRTPSLASDGSRVAYRRQEPDGNYQIWIHDLRLDEPARLTSRGPNFMPEWSGDDTFVYYSGVSEEEDNPYGLVRQQADFAGQPELITEYGSSFWQGLNSVELMDVAPTSDLVLIGAQGPGRPRDIYQVDAAGDRQPRPFMEGDAFYGYAKFSPDGKWLAYTIARSGEANLYVRAFPGGRAGARLAGRGEVAAMVARRRRDLLLERRRLDHGGAHPDRAGAFDRGAAGSVRIGRLYEQRRHGALGYRP
jgi:serine/threonine-protein kinase